MLKSRKTQRQPTSAWSNCHRGGCNNARRLKVEALEGRLMLSATTPEFAPVALQDSYFAVEVGPIENAARQFLPLNVSNDGGYILTDSSGTNWHVTGFFDDSVGRDTILSVGDLDSRGQLFTNGTSDSVGLFGSALDGGLRPVVIVLSNDGDASATTNISLVATPQGNSLGSNEGGAIPIHTVLAGIREEAAIASEQAIPSLASSGPGAAAPTRSVAASSERPISGEWGRAMVFEVAGGEPAAGERSALGGRGSRLRVGEAAAQNDGPLSVIERGREIGAIPSSDQDATRRDGESADVDSQQERVTPPDTQAADDLGGPGSAVVGRNSVARTIGSDSMRHRSNAEREAAFASISADSEISSLAAAAFEQFADDPAARVESSAGTLWGQSWGLAPFLLALALERIAARRSRHPQSEAPNGKVRTPLRPPGSPGTRRT